jgi:hypothetical protein
MQISRYAQSKCDMTVIMSQPVAPIQHTKLMVWQQRASSVVSCSCRGSLLALPKLSSDKGRGGRLGKSEVSLDAICWAERQRASAFKEAIGESLIQ